MKRASDTQRITVFLLFVFGIALVVALAIYWTGGIDKPTPASASLSLIYGASPALAHIFTRMVTREGWKDLYLKPRFRTSWPFWVVGWLVTPLLVAAGTALLYGLFPSQIDSTLAAFRDVSGRHEISSSILLRQSLTVVVFSPILGIFIFGEEFGWRAYLQPKLTKFGARRAILWLGVIWGIWHWPLIAMSVKVTAYVGGPIWIRMLLMAVVTVFMAACLGWLTIKAKTIWPAVLAHAAWDLSIMVERKLILGPTLGQLVVTVPVIILGSWLLFRSPALRDREVPV